MSKARRGLNVAAGLLMIAAGLAFFLSDTESNISVMLFFIRVTFTLRGLSSLYYYLTMARYMVGGKNVLYRSLILLDAGFLGRELSGHGFVFGAAYLAVIHVFGGIVSILRSNESRRSGGPWKLKLAYGMMHLILAAAVTGCAIYDHPWIITVIYGAGLIYAGVLRIVSAFRRTDIVFIQ